MERGRRKESKIWKEGERVGERKKDGGRLIWTEKLERQQCGRRERGLQRRGGDERGRWSRMEDGSGEISSDRERETEKEGETDPCSLGG